MKAKVSHPRSVKQRLVAHQVSFPVPGHGPVLDFSRPVTDHDHALSQGAGIALGALWFPACPTGAQSSLDFLFQPAAGLPIEAW